MHFPQLECRPQRPSRAESERLGRFLSASGARAAARGYRALAIRKLTVPVPTRSMLSLASRKARQEIGIGAAGWRLDGGKDIFRVVQVFAAKCPEKRRSKPWIVRTLAGTADALR
jgi:hypothetical protein